MVHMTSGSGLELPSLRHSPFLKSRIEPHLRARRAPAAARQVAGILALADIRINGNRPWTSAYTTTVLTARGFPKAALVSGESVHDGWWTAEALDEFFARLHRRRPLQSGQFLRHILPLAGGRIFNRQTELRSGKVASEHYDLGNDIYEAMLDSRMQYTCAHWKDAGTLDQAQENKLRLISGKLRLAPGMKVLELGGVSAAWRNTWLRSMLPGGELQHLRQTGQIRPRAVPRVASAVRTEGLTAKAVHETERFDRVVSIGLCEHVGYKNYRTFLELAHRRLRDGGLFLLHTIGGNQSATCTDPWFDKYIFPTA